MLRAAQLKILAVIAVLLLSILGIVTYEHHQKELERQRLERQRQADEQFKKDLLRQEQDPRNQIPAVRSDALKKH